MSETTIEADVVVVGGGIAGASCAYHLAEQGRGVVLLEREAHLGTHSTARSAATLVPGYGGPQNDELTDQGLAFLESNGGGRVDHPLLRPRQIVWVEPTHLDGDSNPPDRGVEIATEEAIAAVPTLRRERVSRAWRTLGGHDIDVDALLQLFISGAKAKGCRVLTSARVHQIDRAAGATRVKCVGGLEVHARLLVNAAGAWADEVALAAGVELAGLVALRRTMFVSPTAAMSMSDPLVLMTDSSCYFKPDVPGLLLCSRGDETPVPACDPSAEELDVAYTIDRINELTTLRIRSVHRTWAGLRVFTPSRQPLVAVHPSDSRFVWCAGLGGTGIQSSVGAGRLVAQIVADLDR